MTAEEIRNKIKDLLKDKKKYLGDKDILDTRGEIFYSSYATLINSKVYIVGFNPSKEVKNPWTIKDELETEDKIKERENPNWSAYDADWTGRAKTFQERSKIFIDAMGIPYKKVFATNAFFETTDSSIEINNSHFEIYYPIHDLFISQIKPKVIICIGYGEPSSFSLLKNAFQKDKNKKTTEIETYNCPCCNCVKYKYFDVCDDKGNHKYRVFGILHFSWNNKENIQFAGKKIREYLDEYKNK